MSMRTFSQRDSQETTASLPFDNEDGGDGCRAGKAARLMDMDVRMLHTQDRVVVEEVEEEPKQSSPEEATTEEEEMERGEEGEDLELKGMGEELPSFVKQIKTAPLYRTLASSSLWSGDGVPCMLTVPPVPRDELKARNLGDRLVVLFMDASQSMVKGDVLRTMMELLQQLRKLGRKATVAVVAYNSKAHLLMAPRPADTVQDSDIKDVLRAYRAAVAPGTDILSAFEYLKANVAGWKAAMHERDRSCLVVEVELIAFTDGEDTGRMGMHLSRGRSISRDRACIAMCDWVRSDPRTTIHVVGLGTTDTLDLPVLRALGDVSATKGSFHVVREADLALVPRRIVDLLGRRGPLVEIKVAELVREQVRDGSEQRLFAWSSFTEATKCLFSVAPKHTVRVDVRVSIPRPMYNDVRLWCATVYDMEAIQVGEVFGDINDDVALAFQQRYLEEVYLWAKTEEYLVTVRNGPGFCPDDDTHADPAFLRRLRGLLATVLEVCSMRFGASSACMEAIEEFCDMEAAALVEDRYSRLGMDGCYPSRRMTEAIEADYVRAMYHSQNSLDLIEHQEESQSQVAEIYRSQGGLEGICDLPSQVIHVERGAQSLPMSEGEEECTKEAGSTHARRVVAVPLIEPPTPAYENEEGTMDLYAYEEMEPIIGRNMSIPEEREEECTKDADADFSAAGGAGAAPSQDTDQMTGDTAVGTRAV